MWQVCPHCHKRRARVIDGDWDVETLRVIGTPAASRPSDEPQPVRPLAEVLGVDEATAQKVARALAEALPLPKRDA